MTASPGQMTPGPSLEGRPPDGPRRPVPPSRKPGLRRLRTVLTIVTAALLVVIIVLIARACASEPGDDASGLEGPLASIVTGTTDQLTPGEASAGLSVLPAEGRVQPSEEDWTRLLPELQRVAEAAPDDADAQRALALAYYNLGQFEEARAIYERLLAVVEDAVLRNRLGNTLRDMADSSGAEAAYRKAIADDATLAAPYLNLADLLWHAGEDDEALAIIDQGLAAVPEESRAALQAGREVLTAAEN
jgi:thioredoxin-like negative regulator of GroEL